MHHPVFQTSGFTRCAITVPKNPVGFIHHIFQVCLPCQFPSRINLRYLTLVVSCKVCPERVGSFRPLKSLLLVSGTIIIFCGLIDSWVLSHHCCTIVRASCTSSETVFRNFPQMRIAMSPAYPSAYHSFSLSPPMSLSTTRLHIRSKRTSPCGQSVVTDPFRFSPVSVTGIFLPPKAHAVWQPLLWC